MFDILPILILSKIEKISNILQFSNHKKIVKSIEENICLQFMKITLISRTFSALTWFRNFIIKQN